MVHNYLSHLQRQSSKKVDRIKTLTKKRNQSQGRLAKVGETFDGEAEEDEDGNSRKLSRVDS